MEVSAKRDEYIKLSKENFLELEKDIAEEGNKWSVSRSQADVVVKQTYKKGKGAEIPCFKAQGVINCSPKDLLENVVLHTENIKVA
jgi:hypothetical protein